MTWGVMAGVPELPTARGMDPSAAAAAAAAASASDAANACPGRLCRWQPAALLWRDAASRLGAPPYLAHLCVWLCMQWIAACVFLGLHCLVRLAAVLQGYDGSSAKQTDGVVPA